MIDHEVTYSGRELRSGWVREQTGLEGDAVAGFIGPCHVATEDLVDLDDARAGAYIEAELMAHVICEHTACSIRTGVLRQRMLVVLLCESLAARRVSVRRDGDDVYYDDRKLTVSVATPSARSSLIHLGINIRPRGAPVPAVGLEELGVDAGSLLDELLTRYQCELSSCEYAEGKVRAVE